MEAEVLAPLVWLVSFAVAVPKVGDTVLTAATTNHHVYRALRHLPLNEGVTFMAYAIARFLYLSLV